MNAGLLALLVIGCVLVGSAFCVLLRMPRERTSTPQVGEMRLADIVQLRGVRFKNFARLFSDADYHALRAEPKLVRIAENLKKDRRHLALNWLKSVQSDVLTLWRLRRLLVSYGVSQGRSVESVAMVRVFSILLFINSLRICVFLFGPFAFHGIILWGRERIESYSRSCQAALWRLPKNKLDDFAINWRARQVLAA
jgi:hypothetical protein